VNDRGFAFLKVDRSSAPRTEPKGEPGMSSRRTSRIPGLNSHRSRAERGATLLIVVGDLLKPEL